eukprot:1279266-Prymnesium_polylepis.1
MDEHEKLNMTHPHRVKDVLPIRLTISRLLIIRLIVRRVRGRSGCATRSLGWWVKVMLSALK